MWYATHTHTHIPILSNRTNTNYTLSMCPTQFNSISTSLPLLTGIKLNIFGKTLWMCRHCASILFECNIIRLYLICSCFLLFFLFTFRSVLFSSNQWNWNGNEKANGKAENKNGKSEKISQKNTSFYNSFIGFISQKEFSILKLHFFYMIFLIHSLIHSFILFLYFSHSISFHFICHAALNLIFLRCRLIGFYCMRLVTLSSLRGYSNWFSKLIQKLFIGISFFPTKIEWCRKQ